MRERYRAPMDLPADAREVWRQTARWLDEQGTLEDSDGEALRRYCSAVSTARAMRAAAHAEPWTTGSTGQLVPHPGWRLAAEADRDAARYAGDLLLTPAARKRAGITMAATDDEKFLAGLGLR